MKKRKVVLSMLAGLLIGSSFAMAACGDENKGINPYQNYQAAISTYLEDPTLFRSDKVNGIQTDFYFDNFYYKNDLGAKVEGDINYITLNAFAMNYIQNYYTELSGLEGDYNYSQLHTALNSLNESFEKVRVESKNVYNVDANESVTIYNGFFSRYEDSAREFIDQAYNTAITLSDFLIEQVDLTKDIGSDNQTTEQIKLYVDSQLLYIFNDFRALLMDSGRGRQFNGEVLYDNSVTLLESFSNLSSDLLQSVTAEMMSELKELSSYLDNERIITGQSLENFSLYDYCNYDSMDGYLKEESNAQIYYNQLQSYYSNSNSTLNQYYLFLVSNIYQAA